MKKLFSKISNVIDELDGDRHKRVQVQHEHHHHHHHHYHDQQAPPLPPPLSDRSRPLVNAAYYPNWAVYSQQPPSNLNVKALTHVFYAFVRINTDGTLRLADEWADTQIAVDNTNGCLAALRDLKRRNPHLRTIISVGGGGGSDEFPAVAASPEKRQTLARSLRAFVDQWEMDGVDIDWEHPTTPSQCTSYLSLLSTLRATFPPPRYLVTSALPAGQWVLQNLDLASAARSLDYVNLMAYDFSGPWTTTAGHHAQLHSSPSAATCAHDAVAYLLSCGIPAEKIVLGVPAYARVFPRARGVGEGFDKEGCGEAEATVNYGVMEQAWVDGATVDEGIGAAWCVVDRGFMTFDVPATVKVTARYVRSRRLGGLFYWTGAGDRQGGESLVLAGWEALRA